MYQRVKRFNRILKIREDSRREEQSILASERREELDVLDRLASLETEKSTAVKEFSKAGEQGMSGTQLWFQRQFIDAIDTDISKGRVSLNDVRQRIAGTEARLVERHKDVRVMEAYIEHLKEAAFKEELDAEQIELDDVATMQYAREQRKGA
ncbi:MAG: flagellar export protein FliJ [Fretibacterium sp.]|nr:flagellar export protein FliJ [Fretibacterium sp.]